MRTEADPIVSQVMEKLRSLGVKGVIFDLDDTLIYTSEIFRRYMVGYAIEVCRITGMDESVFYQRLSDINDAEYRKMGVNPERWIAVVGGLAIEFPAFADVIKGKLTILMQIYLEEPRLRPGAKMILEELIRAGFLVGVVTHANDNWTMQKLLKTGILNFVDAVKIADENGSKAREHWVEGMEMLGLSGSECLVVGDNLKGDVVAGTSLGARGIWMPSPWSIYREGEVPIGVVQIEDLDEFWDGVMRLV